MQRANCFNSYGVYVFLPQNHWIRQGFLRHSCTTTLDSVGSFGIVMDLCTRSTDSRECFLDCYGFTVQTRWISMVLLCKMTGSSRLRSIFCFLFGCVFSTYKLRSFACGASFSFTVGEPWAEKTKSNFQTGGTVSKTFCGFLWAYCSQSLDLLECPWVCCKARQQDDTLTSALRRLDPGLLSQR